MLPSRARLRRPADFARVTRAGGRAGRARLVVHAQLGTEGGTPRIGFVVGRTVGSSVIRNRVRRRLRHLAFVRLAGLPAGVDIVVRALPAAATASCDELAVELDSALTLALRRATERRSITATVPGPARR